MGRAIGVCTHVAEWKTSASQTTSKTHNIHLKTCMYHCFNCKRATSRQRHHSKQRVKDCQHSPNISSRSVHKNQSHGWQHEASQRPLYTRWAMLLCKTKMVGASGMGSIAVQAIVCVLPSEITSCTPCHGTHQYACVMAHISMHAQFPLP